MSLVVAALLLVALIPTVVIALIELSRLNADREDALEQDGRQIVEHLGSNVEAAVAGRVLLLRALSQAPALKRGDLATFHAYAKSVLDPMEGAIVVLDRSPKLLLSTVTPFGAELPPPLNLDVTRRAIETGAPQISNLFASPFTGKPVLAVVLAPRDAPHIVLATISAEWLSRQLSVPSARGWYTAVFDGAGLTAARDRNSEQSVGRPVSPTTWAALQSTPSGWAPTLTREGVAIYSAWKRLDAGWYVIASIDRESADRVPANETKKVAVALTLASFTAIVAALVASAALTRSLKGLTNAVIGFGRGRDEIAPRSSIGEIDAAASALDNAVVERRKADAALRANEARLRTVIETATDAIVVIDAKGVVQSVNPAACRLFGYADDEMIGRNISMLMPEPDRSAHDGYLRAFHETGAAKIIGVGREVLARRKDGSVFSADLAVAEWRLDELRFFTGIMRDVTERKAREDHVRFLLGEVNHRSKNLLAVVQSVARQTAGSNNDFAAKFGGRLQALSANQDMLVSNQWRAVKIHALVSSQLDQFGDFAGDRATIVGPPLDLTANSTQAISMALHELATNAIKYGALSNASGRVDIGWDVDGAEFRMTWSESGGPPVAPPQRSGFGATVFEHMIARSVDGVAKMTFAESGIVWSLRCPRANVVENAPAS